MKTVHTLAQLRAALAPSQRPAFVATMGNLHPGHLELVRQARTLGDPNKARAVGAANGRNPLSIIVPCHRVVGSNGSLTGFAGGIGAKAWLLDHERRVLATS